MIEGKNMFLDLLLSHMLSQLNKVHCEKIVIFGLPQSHKRPMSIQCLFIAKIAEKIVTTSYYKQLLLDKQLYKSYLV